MDTSYTIPSSVNSSTQNISYKIKISDMRLRILEAMAAITAITTLALAVITGLVFGGILPNTLPGQILSIGGFSISTLTMLTAILLTCILVKNHNRTINQIIELLEQKKEELEA